MNPKADSWKILIRLTIISRLTKRERKKERTQINRIQNGKRQHYQTYKKDYKGILWNVGLETGYLFL